MNPCVPYVKRSRNSLKLFAVMTRPVRVKHFKLTGLMQTNKTFILRRLSCDYIEVNVTNSRTIEHQARPLLVLIQIITSVKTGSDYQTRERHYKWSVNTEMIYSSYLYTMPQKIQPIGIQEIRCILDGITPNLFIVCVHVCRINYITQTPFEIYEKTNGRISY